MGFSPNLDYARQELVDVLSSRLAAEDRGSEMEAQWKELIKTANVVEVGDILECDERQWQISLGFIGIDYGVDS